VIQTAARRHLAIWHVRALRERLSAEKDMSEQKSEKLRGQMDSNTPNDKQRLVLKVPSRVSDLLRQSKSPGRHPKQGDIAVDREKDRISPEKEYAKATRNDENKKISKPPREIATISKERLSKGEDTFRDLASSKSNSNAFDIYGETNDNHTTSRPNQVTSSVSLSRVEDTPEVGDQTYQQKSFSALYEIAAVLIQSMWRGFWVRDMLDVDIYCATLIQKSFRGFLCRSRYHEDIGRIVLVQSWWRRNIARDQAAITLAHVIIIQSVYRGHRIRKSVREYRAAEAREKQRKLSIQFQSGFRQRKAKQISKEGRSDKDHEQKRMELAAIVIQTRWRTFVSEAKFIRDLVDILIVQAIVRRWLACTRVARIRQQRQVVKNPTLLDKAHKDGEIKNLRSRELKTSGTSKSSEFLSTKERQDVGMYDKSFTVSETKFRTREAIDPGASDFRRVLAVSDPPEIVNQVIVSPSAFPLVKNDSNDKEGMKNAKSPETLETIANQDSLMIETSPSDEISMSLSQVQQRNTSQSLGKAKSPPASYTRSKVAAFTAIYDRERYAELPAVCESEEVLLSKALSEDAYANPVLGTPPLHQPKSRQIVAYPESYTGKARSNSNYSPQKKSDHLADEISFDHHDQTRDNQLSRHEEQAEHCSGQCLVTVSSEDVTGTILAHSPSDETMQAADRGADRSKRDTSPGRAALLKNGTTTSLVSMWKEKEKKNSIT
jgi:hypothetical protein